MKMKVSALLNIILAASLFALTFFTITTSSSSSVGEYDPWLDTDDDGDIDFDDIVAMAMIYGTSGTPINKTALLLELSLFQKQAREVSYLRIFSLYNYKTEEYWHKWYRIRSANYFSYRFDVEIHASALLNDRVTEELISKTAGSWTDPESAVIQEIAYDLWEVSDGDEEVFVNLAVQLVHQLCHNVTLYAKYPIETIVEGSGDCDNLAVLTASILEAGGFDVVVLLVRADGGSHCMLGVSMSSDPDDLFDYGRSSSWYVDVDGEEYWLIEATWGDPGGTNWIDPATPSAYNNVGAFVGDNPWEEIEIVNIIHL